MTATFLLYTTLSAGEAVSAKVELDAFYSNWGAVYYPRLKWQAKVVGGTVNGFGFIYRDRLPGPWFVNHPLTFTPALAPWMAVRTETGGVPTGYFFQIGPQINFHALKPVSRGAQMLIISYLPKAAGIRVDNWLIAGVTKEFNLGPLKGYLESYERFFPERGMGASYGETWLWLRTKKSRHLLFAPLIRNNKNTWMFGGGIRYTFNIH